MPTANARVGAQRVDANQVRIHTASGLDIRLFADEQVPIDRASLAEVGTLSGIALSVRDLAARGFFGDGGAAVERCVLTPDFHKGPGSRSAPSWPPVASCYPAPPAATSAAG